MSVQPEVVEHLELLGVEYEHLDCEPDLADTQLFCEHYGYSLDESANTIVVASKRPPGEFVACLVLASTRLDVNGMVRTVTGWRKASFAKPEETASLTGMSIGGVTPFALPEGWELLIDGAVIEQPWVIVGAGSRSAKLKVSPVELAKIPESRVVDDLAVDPTDGRAT